MSRQVRLIGGKAHATYWTKDENPYYWDGDILVATNDVRGPVPVAHADEFPGLRAMRDLRLRREARLYGLVNPVEDGEG